MLLRVIAAVVGLGLAQGAALADMIWVYADSGRAAGVSAGSLNRLENAKSECELAMRMSALSGPVGCDSDAECTKMADDRWEQVQAAGLACMAKKGYRLRLK